MCIIPDLFLRAKEPYFYCQRVTLLFFSEQPRLSTVKQMLAPSILLYILILEPFRVLFSTVLFLYLYIYFVFIKSYFCNR